MLPDGFQTRLQSPPLSLSLPLWENEAPSQPGHSWSRRLVQGWEVGRKVGDCQALLHRLPRHCQG